MECRGPRPISEAAGGMGRSRSDLNTFTDRLRVNPSRKAAKGRRTPNSLAAEGGPILAPDGAAIYVRA